MNSKIILIAGACISLSACSKEYEEKVRATEDAQEALARKVSTVEGKVEAYQRELKTLKRELQDKTDQLTAAVERHEQKLTVDPTPTTQKELEPAPSGLTKLRPNARVSLDIDASPKASPNSLSQSQGSQQTEKKSRNVNPSVLPSANDGQTPPSISFD